LENHQAGLVGMLCSTLTAYVRNVSLEDIYLPVLLRACESMGRFLQQRPGFDAQHSHRVFSAHMVEKDGESLKALWIALRRLYRKAIAPKSSTFSVPGIVRTVINLQQKGDTSVNNIDPVYENENWAHSSDNLTQASQALPSPYIFSCLIRTLTWLAPDQRYCRKEHSILWHAFSEDLFSSWDILSSVSSSLCPIGDASNILQDLLAHLFSRVQSSMMVVEMDRDHIDSSSRESYYKCRLCCEPQYIHALCTLTTATIRYALSPSVISLLPAIWSFIFGFSSSTNNWKNALVLTNIWIQQLCTVVLMMDEFLSAGAVYRRHLVSSVREEALVFLIHALELKTKLHLMLYKDHALEDERDSTGPVLGAMPSANEVDSAFGNNAMSPTKPIVVSGVTVEAEKVLLSSVWEEIGWERIYALVLERYESLSIGDANDQDGAFSSGSNIARGRFLLSLCSLLSLFDSNGSNNTISTNAISTKKENFVDAEIAQFLREVLFRVLRELYPAVPVAQYSLLDASNAIDNMLVGFPAYSLEYLLFSEVKEAIAFTSISSTSIGIRRFSSTLLLGIFGNPNMSFEDVTPVVLSTLPSENIIETDFDVFDSSKSNTNESRRSFVGTRRPSHGTTHANTSIMSTDDLDLFQITSSSGIDASKKIDDDFLGSFDSSSANQSDSNTSVGSVKRLPSGKVSFSMPSIVSSNKVPTPVKQSSNTINAKILQMSPIRGKGTSAGKQAVSSPATSTTDVFGGNELSPTLTSSLPASQSSGSLEWGSDVFAISTRDDSLVSSAANQSMTDFGSFAPTVAENKVRPGSESSKLGVVPLPPSKQVSSKDKLSANSLPASNTGNIDNDFAPTLQPNDPFNQNDEFFASVSSVPTPSSNANPPFSESQSSDISFSLEFVPTSKAESTPRSTDLASSGLLSASSAADLDFLGNIGSKSQSNSKPATGVAVASTRTASVSNVPSTSISAKPLTALPPPSLESSKKPGQSSASLNRRLSQGAASKSTPSTTNVAAIFNGLNFDLTTSAATTTVPRSQPPPRPSFGDDWASTSTSWDATQSKNSSNSRRGSLNPPVDPFAASQSTVPTTATSNSDFFAAATSHDAFVPSSSLSEATFSATQTNSWQSSTSQPLLPNLFAPSVTSTVNSTANFDFAPSQPSAAPVPYTSNALPAASFGGNGFFPSSSTSSVPIAASTALVPPTGVLAPSGYPGFTPAVQPLHPWGAGIPPQPYPNHPYPVAAGYQVPANGGVPVPSLYGYNVPQPYPNHPYPVAAGYPPQLQQQSVPSMLPQGIHPVTTATNQANKPINPFDDFR
jgi:hypothetical protein